MVLLGYAWDIHHEGPADVGGRRKKEFPLQELPAFQHRPVACPAYDYVVKDLYA